MSERKKILLRLDPVVHDAIARWAGDELRSTNAQIEFLLRRALAGAGRLPDEVGGMPKRGRPPKRSADPAGDGRPGPGDLDGGRPEQEDGPVEPGNAEPDHRRAGPGPHREPGHAEPDHDRAAHAEGRVRTVEGGGRDGSGHSEPHGSS
ncbi:hypothetical protein Sme01_08280 [Sphaerisporangium melleum]|uniref:Arc-like DNA binding domain-containing protein n=1 Tax=Sphaerisporangium melleum TaxID=321316 RepID=A0A917QWK6_9ACTN|nr:hypothetical protein GCM10007964_13910 [Sphaerisporangium melleum]GII68352.1 hypothetical protein Sme01_08280 [Sphaerisporangium melleum]